MKSYKKYIPFIIIFVLVLTSGYHEVSFFIIGLVVISVGVYGMIFIDLIKKRGKVTNGKIVSYQKDDEGFKTPIIEFTTRNGKLVRKVPTTFFSFKSSFSKHSNSALNENMQVLYDPNNPEKFLIKQNIETDYNAYIFIVIIGLAMAALAALSYLQMINFDDLKHYF
uniref:DUF3592 domain-containing protein n=1 Tax=Flavobacterium sp. TaxID=239 RepID=UPI00404932AD